MFKKISNEITFKLWDHQSEALNFAIDHLNAQDSPCLIRMPTGTGKTGIVACLTMLSNEGSSLVLTPWALLRNQMVSDLKEGFWNKVDLSLPNPMVTSMVPSVARQLLKSSEQQVMVATLTALNRLRRDHVDTYESLAEAVDLVIVDEGHYEPAVEWGKSVKGLNTRTLLLTATPYRNDLKLFRITDPEQSAHHFTHRDAIRSRIIRETSFESLESSPDIPNHP
ncbi:MAG: DEAD/DEAH box helicase [Anaerolineales bacterium]